MADTTTAFRFKSIVNFMYTTTKNVKRASQLPSPVGTSYILKQQDISSPNLAQLVRRQHQYFSKEISAEVAKK